MSKPIRAFVIQPDDNHATETVLPGGDSSQLKHLQEVCGGWVQAVPNHTGNVWFWCDEDGKIKGLPVNGLATAYWWAVTPEAVNVDTLCGPVVVTGSADRNGATLPVPDDMAKLIQETYVEE